LRLPGTVLPIDAGKTIFRVGGEKRENRGDEHDENKAGKAKRELQKEERAF